jgi:hypothetical protein
MTDVPAGPTRVAAFTMANNEAAMLPRWVDYYGRSLGLDNLLVIDDNSTDGSTQGLPCTVQHLPAPPWKQRWGPTRRQLANNLARAYLAVYDAVLFTDVDEFLVPDPARYDGLLDYVARHPDREVLAGVGLNMLHAPEVEGPLDPARPVLSQRRFVKFAPNMSKPSIKRVANMWMPGFHGIKGPFSIDRDLWLLHLKYFDVEHTRAVAHERQRVHHEFGRGHEHSAWQFEASELVARQLSWVEGAHPQHTPEFDPAEPDLAGVVTEYGPDKYRSGGTQMAAMEESPLRRLPARLGAPF